VAVQPISYDEVIGSDEGVAAWVNAIAQFGFGLVTGTPSDIESATELANRVGYVRRTIFGDMWVLSSQEVDHADSAYSTTYLEPHTDGSYSHDGPGLQLFACVERSGTGGDSILVDGFAAAEALRADNPDAFGLLSTVEVPAHYVEHGVELRARRPTIRLDANGAVEQVTFNNYDRSAFLLPPDQLRDWYAAYGALHDLIIDEGRWWTHRLEPGDTLLFDNWRCLHGRLAYTGARKFHGCYLNHEDLESRLRVAAS
jgi:trimethyllysine dioxygenase